MAIEVVPYTAAWITGVKEFNRRMHAGGTPWGWYESDVDSWIPPRPGQRVWREHYLAIEDGKHVRGAYALKPQEFWLQGTLRIVADYQGPVSEGILSRRYNTLGVRLIRDMLKRQPLLYSWGHGGLEQAMLQMLRSLGWSLLETPACLYVLHPFRFLRRNRYLRGSAARRIALDLLAGSGLGWLGVRALQHAQAPWPRTSPDLRAEVVSEFGAWADALWERSRDGYRAIAVRDAATMNVLLPEGRWPPGIRLRVWRGAETVGWAVVLDTPMEGDARFGDLRVGTIIDCLAPPEDANDVIGAAFGFLRERGCDLVFSNQSHPDWIRALGAHGFLILKGRRLFAASRALREALEPFEATRRGLHLTNMDGHGPMVL
jgi:hypothetical protein